MKTILAQANHLAPTTKFMQQVELETQMAYGLVPSALLWCVAHGMRTEMNEVLVK